MAVKIVQLKDFLRRLRIEGPKPRFTWLVGAGMSVSSGIPLATTTSDQIIVFEYLSNGILDGVFPNPIPNIEEDELSYNNRKGLTAYFDWYDDCLERKDQSFLELRQNARLWLKQKIEFEKSDIDSPETYQKLFNHFFQSTTTHHHFLTTIVSRRKGINLAHLGLAGLLRDHPEWGHTVFTTNFDDLLLEAIHSLNYTARIFGDLEIQSETDSPSLEPSYPQIVHLHGRHTSYRLLNTPDQLAIIDPTMQHAFEKHLAESHLIVVGYSGWNDLVMRTLKRNPHLLKGTLFWVPYQDSSTIRKEVNEFLDDFPPSKAVVVVDDKKPLDADSFLLSLSQVINAKNNGFSPYRKGVLYSAERQHAFTLKQLKEHPIHDPNRILDLAIESQRDIHKLNTDNANAKLDQAWKLVENIQDIPKIIQGRAFLEMAAAHTMLYDYEKALECLTLGNDIWEHQGYNRVSNIYRLKMFSMLGEVYYRLGDTAQAFKNLNIAKAISKRGEIEFVGYSYVLRSQLLLQQGRESHDKLISPAQNDLNKSLEIFSNMNDEYGLAVYHKAQGNVFAANRNYQEADVHFEAARKVFTELGDHLGLANTLFDIGRTRIGESKLQDSKRNLLAAEEIYKQQADLLGLANVKASLGDISRLHGKKIEALKQYKESLVIYSQVNAAYGIELAKIEILELEFDSLSPSECKQELEVLEALNEMTNSRQAYFRKGALKKKLNQRIGASAGNKSPKIMPKPSEPGESNDN